METKQAIETRHSIRKFKPDALTRQQVEAVLRAGTLAPSAKNSQPWRFLVVSGDSRWPMIEAMAAGIDEMKTQWRDDPAGRLLIGGAMYTLRTMKKAPVTVLIFDISIERPPQLADMEEWTQHNANTQSLGAAIQNMCLAATDMGLGSLWICDIFMAHRTLSEWAAQPGTLVAALSLGYADEDPPARPRKPLDSVTTWRE